MTAPLFHGATTVKARALYLGQRIDVRALEATNRITPVLPIVVQAGERGCAVVFRYGVVALFNVTPLEEVSLLAGFTKLVGDPFPRPEIEDIEPGVFAVMAFSTTM